MTIAQTRPAAPAASPQAAREDLPRNIFPVGARFPRLTPETELAYRDSVGNRSAARVVVYPVGARFPRRDAVTVVVSVGGDQRSQILPPTVPRVARTAYPIGARFPRRRG